MPTAVYSRHENIFRTIKRLLYSRLYRKLFKHYAGRFNYAYEAAAQADEAFLRLTGEDWDDWI